MERRRLRETLEELHGELERSDSLDAESRALLEEVMGDIHEALERSGGDPDNPSLIDRLREAAHQFEESHPTVTAAVGRVADALSNLGI